LIEEMRPALPMPVKIWFAEGNFNTGFASTGSARRRDESGKLRRS
jgi:hypothetical protein